MMRTNTAKLLATLSLWLLWGSLRAQYSLLPVPPAPQFTFTDLWHFTLIRNQSDAYARFYVGLRVYDGKQALRIKSNSATFVSAPGSHYYDRNSLSTLQPFATSYYDASVLQQAVASGGIFPPGSYAAVYTLYGRADDGEFVPLAEESLAIEVESLWLPMLLSPADGDTVPTVYPLLTWTPAFASGLSGPINYSLRLVELFPGQNRYQALQANPSYFSATGIPVSSLPYPGSAQALDTGKTYVWQVQADAGGSPLGSSEIWTFTLGTPEAPDPSPKPKSYFRLSEKIPAEFVLVSGNYLPLAIDERYHSPSGGLRFTMYDTQMEAIGTEKDFDSTIKAGLNLYHISVCAHNSRLSLKKGRYYIEVYTEKKGSLFLAFELKNTDCHAK